MRRSSRISSTLAFASLTLAVGAGISGCELSNNAKKSADNSKQAADNSTNLLDLNNNAYGDGRQGGARDRREKALETMTKATSLEAKLASAAAYYSALEYQLYKDGGFREDDEAKRVRLMTEGVSELMKIQKDYRKPDYTAAMSAALGDESVRSSFALAGAMQKISERQLEASKRYDFVAKSMFDILSEAMRVKAGAESDPRILAAQPGYIYEALRESADLTGFFEMRVNLFAGTALKAIGVPVASAEGKLTITATAVQLQDAADRLKLALQSSAVLAAAGATPRLFADVSGGLEKLVGALNATPTGALESIESPNVAKLLEVKALAEKLTNH